MPEYKITTTTVSHGKISGIMRYDSMQKALKRLSQLSGPDIIKVVVEWVGK